MTSSDPGVTTSRPRPLTLAALVVVALVPLALLRQTLRPVDDPDAFWHILSGQNVWRTHDVVVSDPFGRFSTNPWVQIDWLSDLTMAGTYRLGGLPAVSWLYTVLGLVLFAVLYAACRQVAIPVVAAIAAILGWVGTYASQGFRPQTVSFILLAVTLLAWQRVRAGSDRTPWWLVGVMYVWSCLHGLWVLGPLVGAAVVAGMAVDRSRPWRPLGRLAAVPLLGVVVAALTPVGPRLVVTPFTVSSYAGLVSEWRPPDVHEPYVAATVLLIAVTAVSWARSSTRAGGPELLLWLMALGWTLLYTRTVAVGAVIAAPLAARALMSLLPVPADPAARRIERLAVPGGVLLAVAVAALLAPTRAAGTSGMPAALDPAIQRLPTGTVVLNDDAVGGWLMLEHPDLHPVIDTRTYLFDVPYIQRYVAARAASGDWTGFVSDTGATAALLPEGQALAPRLHDDLGWTEAARADGFVLLTAPGTAR